jgi:hypothetical protein
MTKFEELIRLADAAMNDKAEYLRRSEIMEWSDAAIEAVCKNVEIEISASTVKRMVELLVQCREALQELDQLIPVGAGINTLAALDAFEGGEMTYETLEDTEIARLRARVAELEDDANEHWTQFLSLVAHGVKPHCAMDLTLEGITAKRLRER